MSSVIFYLNASINTSLFEALTGTYWRVACPFC